MNLTNRVEQILREHPKARSSDSILFVELMAAYDIRLTPVQEDKFLSMPSLESARRVRQKLQEQGQYPASESVRRERSHKAMVMQQTMPTSKPKEIEKKLNYRILPWGKG